MIPRVRRILLIAAALGALALSGCGSHAKNDALGKMCNRVNNAIPSIDMSRRQMATFEASLAQWARAEDQATRSALAPLVTSADAYATAPTAQRSASRTRFWHTFKELANECQSNGTPMRP